MRSAIGVFQPDATILLGYPDQFLFLGDSDYRPGLTYLWAQFSHVPPPLPGALAIIPLTPKSAEFAEGATKATIGPVVPHAADLTIFGTVGPDRRRYHLPDLFTVGIVATNQLRKRLDRFLDACELALGDLPSIHFCIKTDRISAPGGFDLSKEIVDRRIAESVTVIDDLSSGRGLSSHDLATLYACFNLYLHTSEWEGFGIPAIEAIASGVPVATHRGQGPGEFTPYPELEIDSTEVTDESGATLTYVDPESAVGAIRRVIHLNRSERDDFSTRGKRAARESFDARRVASTWIDIIRHD